MKHYPAANENQCKAIVSREGWPGACRNNPTRDGFCVVHHPETIKRKRDKWHENYEAKRAEENAMVVMAEALCRRLGVKGTVAFGIRGYIRAICIPFEEAAKLAEKMKPEDASQMQP